MDTPTDVSQTNPTVGDAQVADQTVEQANALPGPGSDAVQTPDPASAVSPEPATPDWASMLSDESTRDQVLSNPAIAKAIADRANTQSQKRLAEMQREAANAEGVERFLAERMRKHGVEWDSLDDAERAEIRAVTGLNRQHELARLLREIPEVLMQDYALPGETVKAAVDRMLEGDRNGYMQTLIDAAASHRAASYGLKDVPSESALRKEIDAEIASRVEAELKAHGKEVQTANQRGVPGTPTGASPGGLYTAEQLDRMTPQEVLGIDPDVLTKSLAAL